MSFSDLTSLLDACRNDIKGCGVNPMIQLILLGTILLISSFYLFRPVRFFVRCFIFFIIVTIASTLSLPLVVFCSLMGTAKNCHRYVGRLFAFLCQLLLRQKYYIIDDRVLRELKGPAIIVCNHQSTLDLGYMGAIFPENCSIMVKKSLQYVPFLGIYLRLSSTFMIDRKNHGRAMATTKALAKTMIDSQSSVLIFPEGTRSGLDTPNLLPFKKGAFHLALETGYPIVPIVFSNTSHLASSKHWRFESGGMGIKVLDPISPFQYTKETVHDFVEFTHSTMKTCLQDITEIDYNHYQP